MHAGGIGPDCGDNGGADEGEWLQPGGGDAAGLRETYVNCPFQGDHPPDAGAFSLSHARIKEARLFDRRRRKLVVSGDHTGKETQGQTQTKTIPSWNLRLTRVKEPVRRSGTPA